MLRRNVRLVWTGALAAAVVVPAMLTPSAVVGQSPPRVQVRAPSARTPAARTPAARTPTVRAPAVRPTPSSTVRRPVAKEVADRGRDDRSSARDDRGSVRDNRGSVRDDQGWGRLRGDTDLRLFGFLNIDVRWDHWDRDDRRRWVARYDHYSGRGDFYGPIDGWYRPHWGAIRFEQDPLRYGPRGLDSKELRRVLGRRTFDRIVREAPGRSKDFWARVERFGPRGQSITLEIWSGNRFVAAMTDFDRDGWVDDVELNGRVFRR